MTTTPSETQSGPLDKLAGKAAPAPVKRNEGNERDERDEAREDAERWADLPCTD